jgi:hypothetical protein
MATSGDRYLATSGDFPMARDTRTLKASSRTQTREYPTTGQAAAASGPQTRRWSENDVLGGWVDGHCVAEVFELRY